MKIFIEILLDTPIYILAECMHKGKNILIKTICIKKI
jgi:hypothetical protein